MTTFLLSLILFSSKPTRIFDVFDFRTVDRINAYGVDVNAKSLITLCGRTGKLLTENIPIASQREIIQPIGLALPTKSHLALETRDGVLVGNVSGSSRRWYRVAPPDAWLMGDSNQKFALCWKLSLPGELLLFRDKDAQTYKINCWGSPLLTDNGVYFIDRQLSLNYLSGSSLKVKKLCSFDKSLGSTAYSPKVRLISFFERKLMIRYGEGLYLMSLSELKGPVKLRSIRGNPVSFVVACTNPMQVWWQDKPRNTWHVSSASGSVNSSISVNNLETPIATYGGLLLLQSFRTTNGRTTVSVRKLTEANGQVHSKLIGTAFGTFSNPKVVSFGSREIIYERNTIAILAKNVQHHAVKRLSMNGKVHLLGKVIDADQDYHPTYDNGLTH